MNDADLGVGRQAELNLYQEPDRIFYFLAQVLGTNIWKRTKSKAKTLIISSE